MNNYVNEQVVVLLDKNVDESGRDDIAMDLSDSDDVLVLDSLIAVASDEDDSQLVRGSCMESIAEILYRNKDKVEYLTCNRNRINKALSIIKQSNCNLYKNFHLTELE